jgi:two-component system CheB/CheR fusion protein
VRTLTVDEYQAGSRWDEFLYHLYRSMPVLRGVPMKNATTSSWRRKTDSSARVNAQNLEAWEGEGGSSGRVSSEVLKILVVDNDMRAADAFELMLHAAGYPETCVAYSGHAALAFAVEFRPDVAFLEMDLLDIGSNELAQQLRERAQRHPLRLIAMTSNRQHDGREIARNAGFEQYLLKPVATAEVSSLLATPT